MALNLDQDHENRIVNKALSKLPRPFVTGMELNGDIRINGLTLNTIDENEVLWVCTDIENWWSLPTSEIPDIPRGLDDGSYDVRGRWTPRILTLTGSILPPDASKAPAARTKLMQTFDLVKKGAWLFVDESPKKAAFVRLSGQPVIQNTTARGRIDFSIQLKASDPIKYGWNGLESGDGYVTASIGSSATVQLDGNTPVAALFSITGPITAPAYIRSTNDAGEVQTIKIIKDLRSSAYAVTTVTNRELQSGLVTLVIGDHGFMVGDVVTVTSVSTDFNATSVKITAITANSISYIKYHVSVSSVSLTANVATITTSAAHGVSVGSVVYVTDCNNPLLDGQYTISTVPTTTTFTAPRTMANQGNALGGMLSKQITSTSSTGTVTLVTADTLDIDTYNSSTNYRGAASNSRSMLDANISWIKLYPGENVITFNKTGGTGAATVKYRPGWIG